MAIPSPFFPLTRNSTQSASTVLIVRKRLNPFGPAAKKHTTSFTAQKVATVEVYDTDQYGRKVGVVNVDVVNVNRNLIQAGYAWQYQQYCKEAFCGDWLDIENRARKARIGLWTDPEPMPPWEWRRRARSGSQGKKNDSPGVFHGNLKSHVFHRSSCRDYNCKNCVETFQSREAAITAGYRSCGRCKP